MTAAVTKAVLQSGLVPDRIIQEFRKWRLPVEIPDAAQEQAMTQGLLEAISEALEADGYQITRETHLEALTAFVQTQRLGTLSFSLQGVREEFMVAFGRLPITGEILIPWRSEGIQDVMANGETYLQFTQDGHFWRLYFQGVVELFFDEKKSFMCCSPGRLEKGDPIDVHPE